MATNSTLPPKSVPPGASGCVECDRLRSINADLLAACEAAIGELRAYRADCEDYEAPEGVAELDSVIARTEAAIAKAAGSQETRP